MNDLLDLVCIWSCCNLLLLLNRPIIYQDESDIGYLHRLAAVNHHPIRDLGLKYPRLDDEETVLEKFLAALEDKSEQRPCPSNIIYYWCLKDFTLPQWKIRYNSRFCPRCLDESQYHRTVWSLSHYTYCKKHRLLLLENCPICSRNVLIGDIVSGSCSGCGFKFSNSMSMEPETGSLFLENNGLKNSPYLTQRLNTLEQLKLTQRLLYCLITNAKLCEIDLSSVEKAQLAKGYITDAARLNNLMNLSCKLLQEWPSKLILFLNDHFMNNDNKTSKFMRDFIYFIKDVKIRTTLWTSYNREDKFRDSTKRYKPEQQYIDGHFIPVIDLEDVYTLDFGTLYQLVQENKIQSIVHPRMGLTVIESKISALLNKPGFVLKNDYVSIRRAAEIWGVVPESVGVLCKMFRIRKKELFNEPCFRLLSVNKFIQKVKKYTTLHEIVTKSIWDYPTVKRYLQRKNVKITFQSNEYSWWDYVYLKEDAREALISLNNEISDYMDRAETIKLLGMDLYKAARLEGYHLQRLNETPFYARNDIIAAQNLFEELKDLNKVLRYRERQLLGLE